MLKTIVKAQLAAQKLKDDIKGASLIEYSLLIGIIAAAVVVTIGLVGDKIVAYWETLNGAMPGGDAPAEGGEGG